METELQTKAPDVGISADVEAALSSSEPPAHFCSAIEFDYGQATDAGVKLRNEDSLGIRVPADANQIATKGITAIIADGVSAAEAAREAADICVLGFLNDYYSTPESWRVKTSAHRVLTALNRWLFAEGQSFRDEGRGFVCAMSALIVKGTQAYVFHVGDTRVWRLRDGKIEIITRDHCHRISESQEYLSRAMGLSLSLKIDYYPVDLRVDDTLLLTTDGVHSCLRPDHIAKIASDRTHSADSLCKKLISEALSAGSKDNVSCQLLHIQSLPTADSGQVFDEVQKLPLPPDLDPGMKLDGWEVEKILDASPRSQLYAVRDVSSPSGRRAVMKTPSINYEDDSGYLERFLMEEWIGRRIESRRVVQVLEKPRPPKFLYYLMEHVMGQPLSVLMRQPKPIDVSEMVGIVRQIVEGLRALHRKEVLHQDLKPDNILIDVEGSVKIIDFGSAQIGGIAELQPHDEEIQRLGTARYSAPEYRVGPSPDRRADLFSLGVIAYELITGGHHPWGDAFERADSPGQFARLNYVSACRHNPLTPVWLDGALRRAVDLSPDRRYPVLSEFLADLERPNPAFLRKATEMPLLQRDPLRFWKSLSALLGVAWAITLWLMLRG